MQDQKKFSGIMYLFASLALWKPYILVKTECIQMSLYVFRRDVVGRTLYKTGCWDKPITEYLLGKINKTPINVIDVGANLGYYSCLFSLKSSINSRIIAIEPDNENFNILLKNIELNSLKNINAKRVAVGDISGPAHIKKYKTSNRGKHQLVKGAAIDNNVEAVTLDDLLIENFRPNEKIDFLKIDIEGYELRALRGAQEMLKRTKNIIIEYLPEEYDSSDRNEMRIMLGSNFKYYLYDAGGGIKQASIDEILSSQEPVNIIAYK
jgi:FkbM family methyltransferase